MSKLHLIAQHRAEWARTARPILERLAFALYLAAFAGACGLIGLGLIFALLLGEVRPLCVGLAGGAFARLLQQHGYRAWHFAKWEDSLEPSDAHADFGRDPIPSDHLDKFHTLLTELESEEQRDIWSVQEIRHRLKALLTRHPELREACASELSRHPELD